MSEASAAELREALTGTLIGVARIAELLIEEKLLARDELTALLSAGNDVAHDFRRPGAATGLRRLLERGPDRDGPRGAVMPPSARIDQLQSRNDVAERRSRIKQRTQTELTAYYAALSGAQSLD